MLLPGLSKLDISWTCVTPECVRLIRQAHPLLQLIQTSPQVRDISNSFKK